MGPHKTTKGASSSGQNVPMADSTTKAHAKRRKQGSTDHVLGVQKIKGALRQTRRLLAKKNLAADVRVTTERRLKSLEGDLARAELARTERAMASRYHKVKFFERQKALRKITRTNRILDSGVDAEGKKLSKKQRKAMEAELLERRVDLNYILHYPKASKYISLYPPNSTADGDEGSDSEGEKPQIENKEGPAITVAKRQGLRDSIRLAMDSGQISLQPETDLANRAETGDSMSAALLHQGEASTSKVERSKGSKTAKSKPKPAPDLNDDSFFEMTVD